MYIFVENHYYEYQLIKPFFDDADLFLSRVSGKACVNFVGYYKNKHKQICLILPKIFMEEGKLLRTIPAEDFITDPFGVLKKNGKSNKEVAYATDLFINMYRVLKVYQERHTVQAESSHLITSNEGKDRVTLLDCLITLRNLHKKHKQLFARHKVQSLRTGKISWSKTMKQTQPYVIDNQVLYLNPVYKKNQNTQDDLLIKIFHSVLNDINVRYGMKIPLDVDVPMVTGHEYANFQPKALKVLNQLKGTYFSDALKEILNSLLVYFGWNDRQDVHVKQGDPEYLLTDNFNLVFEDIVDALISDREDLAHFKEQKDGKILDHLYHDRSPLSNDCTFYVGDSKYYKDSKDIGDNSIFKQVTYARNLCQLYVNPSPKHRAYFRQIELQLRDPATEGYNIIPNFFILADIDHDDYSRIPSPALRLDGDAITSAHFPNRLFDRDTHTVFYFKINFNYAVMAYLDCAHSARNRQATRNTIRETIWRWYFAKYQFYLLGSTNLATFVRDNFHQLHGKVFNYDFAEHTVVLGLDRELPLDTQRIIDLCHRNGITTRTLLCSDSVK